MKSGFRSVLISGIQFCIPFTSIGLIYSNRHDAFFPEQTYNLILISQMVFEIILTKYSPDSVLILSIFP